jgi:hypothetical protein
LQRRCRLSRTARGVAGVLLALLALSGAAAGADLRDFSGTVTAVSARELTVEGGAGDVRRFVRAEGVRVDGERGSWDALRVGDSVVVGWSLTDEPVAARRVHVVSTAADR